MKMIRPCKHRVSLPTYLRVEILSESNRCANDTAKVEYGPENTDKSTLLALRGVTHHERALGSPKQTSADTENSTGGDDEAACIRVHIDSPVGESVNEP